MTANLLDYDLEGLAAFCASLGEKKFRATQLFRWIHQKGASDFAQMTDLAKSLRDKLQGSAGFAVQPGRQRRHKGLLWGVYVASELRGKGLAKALIERVIARARGHVALLQAVVSAGNEPARRLYFDLGFRTYGIEPAGLRVDSEDIDEELIWLDLRGGDSLPPDDLSDRRAP